MRQSGRAYLKNGNKVYTHYTANIPKNLPKGAAFQLKCKGAMFHASGTITTWFCEWGGDGHFVQ